MASGMKKVVIFNVVKNISWLLHILSTVKFESEFINTTYGKIFEHDEMPNARHLVQLK
jgi:hypothetical protein